MKQPATIASLLGQSSAGLSPTSGHCLELLISGANEEPIMAQMAIETAVSFSIISGALDQYRSGKLGNFMIHVEKEADAEKKLRTT